MAFSIQYEIGDVLKRENDYRVVTELVNGKVTKTEQLEMYVAKNIVLGKDQVGWKVSDIITFYAGEYVSKNRVFDLPI